MKQRGFTFIELLVSMGLMALVAGSGLLIYSQVKRQQELTATVSQIAQLLATARRWSLANKQDRAWKVVFNPDRVSVQDSLGNVTETYRLPSGYEVSGPASEVEFYKVNGWVGNCNPSCLFEVRSLSGNDYYQFRILQSGAVEY